MFVKQSMITCINRNKNTPKPLPFCRRQNIKCTVVTLLRVRNIMVNISKLSPFFPRLIHSQQKVRYSNRIQLGILHVCRCCRIRVDKAMTMSLFTMANGYLI